MTEPGPDLQAASPGEGASRRAFLGQAAAAAGVLAAGARPAAAEIPTAGHGRAEIAARDAANVAASAISRTRPVPRYQPLSGGIVHFFGYGQSLSGGWYGVPVLSATQPMDNLMIGQSTRATSQLGNTTTWVPVGTPDSNGNYQFMPMIATPELSGESITAGETPGEGALNFLRHAYLRKLGLGANPACRFVLTNCSAGGHTVAELGKGANPEIFNRLRDAANAVKASAAAAGLSYQVGGVIWTHGESDEQDSTSYADYLSGFQALQQAFLTDIVQTIGGQPPGVTVPWFTDQPDYAGLAPGSTLATYQALLDWSNTPGSDLYLAGPIYQYPNHNTHLTANGYRWHANQVGKAMRSVFLDLHQPRSLHVASATASGTSLLVDVSVAVPPLIQGDAYVLYASTVYPGLGFIVTDSAGMVPIVSVSIVGAATIQIILGRSLGGSPMLQAGYSLVKGEDWGTNICDSCTDATTQDYVYTAGVQDPGEDIATWNGKPLIGKPYPLANYLAIGAVPIVPG